MACIGTPVPVHSAIFCLKTMLNSYDKYPETFSFWGTSNRQVDDSLIMLLDVVKTHNAEHRLFVIEIWATNRTNIVTFSQSYVILVGDIQTLTAFGSWRSVSVRRECRPSTNYTYTRQLNFIIVAVEGKPRFFRSILFIRTTMRKAHIFQKIVLQWCDFSKGNNIKTPRFLTFYTTVCGHTSEGVLKVYHNHPCTCNNPRLVVNSASPGA
jgi:hypothetical protein